METRFVYAWSAYFRVFYVFFIMFFF